MAMTDREKLVKLIEESASLTGYVCMGEWNYSLNTDDIADHMISNGVTVQNWRDAKTDPPKEWKGADEYLINYMVYCPQFGVDVGNYVEPAQRWVVMGLPAPVTHWQPLPEAPKE
jgi:hypothetical protein